MCYNALEVDMTDIRLLKQSIDKLGDAIIRFSLNFKEVLTLEEAEIYTGRSDSNLYKLTSDRLIPHYKPTKKLIYFSRTELDQWMLRNRVQTQEEIAAEAAVHVARMRKAN
jgi:excisionase family DNA binding protein